MEADVRSSQTKFDRRKKNLLIFSMLLLFFQLSGASFAEVKILGTELTMKNPFVVYGFIWAFYAYWFLMYYQTFMEIKNKGFKDVFYEKLDKLAKDIAFNKIINNEDIKKRFPEKDGGKIYRHNFSILHSSTEKYRITVGFLYGNKYGSGTIENKTLNINKNELRYPIFKSIINIPLNTTLVSEYMLPFIIFSLPIINYNGSIKMFINFILRIFNFEFTLL